MAYIDKTKLLTDINNGIKAGNLEEGYEQYQNINNMDDIIETIEWADEADVVERSEYIESRKEVLRLGDLFHKANQNAMKYERMYMELRSKLDKAIEEIIKYRNDETNDFCDVEVGAINGALEIFKNILGE